MDFKKLKDKALELKNKAIEISEKAVDYGTEKLIESGFVINNKEELDKIILKSKTTSFTNKETGEVKKYKHKSIIILADEKSEFFNKLLYIFPIITTKAFSQNISVKLSKAEIDGVKLNEYSIEKIDSPTLIVYEEEKILKTIKWEENILKLVKSFSLDINKLINDA